MIRLFRPRPSTGHIRARYQSTPLTGTIRSAEVTMTSAPVLSVTTTGSGPEGGANVSPASFSPARLDS